MLFLLSPAKTLDFETPLSPALRRKATAPLHADRAAELIELLCRRSPAEIARLMDLSTNLAELNAARYAAWQPQATPANSRPALRAFDGDVYDGLQAATLASADLNWAQDHLVILSGLYGVLRPLDSLQPYRLEMGTALANARGRDLYAYWGDLVAEHLNARQAGEKAPVVVNLASIEYARAALRPALRARVVDCVFEESRDGEHKIVGFFAKKARGMMMRHAILRRARSPRALLDYDGGGYAWDRAASAPDRLVFRRPATT
ncbi:MAG: peroxide stress protein YaaA [Burkholderiales bacterium]|nr:peroxide stress protein YaaA [Burkholderiales bacterium]